MRLKRLPQRRPIPRAARECIMPIQGTLIAKTFLTAGTLVAIASAQSLIALQEVNPVSRASSQIEVRATVQAQLAKSIDAKRAKAGSRIEARLTMDLLSHGKILLPRGTEIIGHIIDAKVRTKQVRESRVEIAFDRIVLKTGGEIPLKARIQAVGAPIGASARDPDVGDLDLARQTESRPGPGPNEMKSILGSYPGSRRPANAAEGADPTVNGGSSANMARSLGPASQGVVGMKGITMSSTAQGCAISSTRENVHLSGGTQLVLRLLEPQVLNDSLQRTRN
jgi:hypothetical protein